MIVQKYGGTSVGTPDRVRQVAEIVRAARSREPVVVVVSAHAGVTDLLLALAEQAAAGAFDLGPLEARHRDMLAGLDLDPTLLDVPLSEARTLLTGVAMLRELTPRSRDYLVSFGERLSSRVMAAHLRAVGVDARAFDAWDAGLVTDAAFGAAQPLEGAPAAIEAALAPVIAAGCIPVITGFLGRTEQGQVTTLGRGGSDYSAAIFGAALGAREIQIWTDVDGVMTTDPRIVREARILEDLSYAEAAELAFFGAKVLHPRTIQPAIEEGVPIRVLNTARPEGQGTRIHHHSTVTRGVLKAIALRRGVKILNVVSSRMLGAHGFIQRLGEVFARHGVAIDMMATSEVSVSLTVAGDAVIEPIVNDLADVSEVAVLDDFAILCLVGEGLRDTPGLGARIFRALGDAGVNVHLVSQGASQLNLGLCVREAEAERAVRALHFALFET